MDQSEGHADIFMLYYLVVIAIWDPTRRKSMSVDEGGPLAAITMILLQRLEASVFQITISRIAIVRRPLCSLAPSLYCRSRCPECDKGGDI